MKKVFIYIICLFLFSACSFDIIGKSDSSDYLRTKTGRFVYDCYGGAISKDFAVDFWQRNNLPKRTTEFVCVDGKAYLPGKAPKQ